MQPFPEVDPSAESTWKNHARPYGFPTFEDALRKLGGEHVNGHPNLILRWAPDHFRVSLGRPRFYYVDTRIPTRKRINRLYYQVRLISDPFAPWITVEPDDLGNYTEGRYLHTVHHDSEIVTISRQQWVIEQYFPPERLAAEGITPESWNRNRWRMFIPPETNLPEYGDDIGPFPSEGEYRSVAILEGEGSQYSYRAPCERDLQVLQQAFQMREAPRRNVSRERQVANEYADAEAADQKRLAELDQRLAEEMKPYEREFEGNAFVAVPNKSYNKEPERNVILTDSDRN